MLFYFIYINYKRDIYINENNKAYIVCNTAVIITYILIILLHTCAYLT